MIEVADVFRRFAADYLSAHGASMLASHRRAIEDILTSLLQLTLQLTGVERGFVFLRANGEMKLARGLNADGQLLAEDSTISRRAMQRAIESDAKIPISAPHLVYLIRSPCCVSGED